MPLQRKQNSKLLWILIGGLSILVVLFLAAQWFFKKTESSAPMVDPHPVSTLAPIKTTDPSSASEPIAAEAASSPQLVNEDVLKQPVPAQESLAKEEVSKLDDIHRQLQDQESLLKAQHADADQLTKLKEEQVKLLEAQLKHQ